MIAHHAFRTDNLLWNLLYNIIYFRFPTRKCTSTIKNTWCHEVMRTTRKSPQNYNNNLGLVSFFSRLNPWIINILYNDVSETTARHRTYILISWLYRWWMFRFGYSIYFSTCVWAVCRVSQPIFFKLNPYLNYYNVRLFMFVEYSPHTAHRSQYYDIKFWHVYCFS